MSFRSDKTCSLPAAIDEKSAPLCDRCILLTAMTRMKNIIFQRNAAKDYGNHMTDNNQFYF